MRTHLTGRLASMCLISIAALLIACPIVVGSEQTDKDSLSQFLTGTYSVIGKKPGSNSTYQGAATIVQTKNGLNIVRCVAGKRSTGSAEIVELTADRITTIKYSYKEGASTYQGRYDIHSDLNNYARLSGPYARKGFETTSGWELLYIDENSPVSCR